MHLNKYYSTVVIEETLGRGYRYYSVSNESNKHLCSLGYDERRKLVGTVRRYHKE